MKPKVNLNDNKFKLKCVSSLILWIFVCIQIHLPILQNFMHYLWYSFAEFLHIYFKVLYSLKYPDFTLYQYSPLTIRIFWIFLRKKCHQLNTVSF